MPKNITENNYFGQIDHTKKAYRGIRKMLFHKEIVPGQKIAYRDLSERLRMSPTPVIQALKFLEFQGLVRHEPNRGYYTEPISLEEAREIYELREILEISLLPDTITNLNEQGIKQLQTVLEAHLNADREPYLKERILTDMEFHLTLASLSKGKIKQQILRTLLDILCLKYRGNYLSVTSFELTDTEHQAIFEAVTAKDLSRAQHVLSQHISNVKRRMLKSLERLMEEKEKAVI